MTSQLATTLTIHTNVYASTTVTPPMILPPCFSSPRDMCHKTVHFNTTSDQAPDYDSENAGRCEAKKTKNKCSVNADHCTRLLQNII